MIVTTVTGPIDSDRLGLVLPHEHLHNDASVAYSPSPDPVVAQILAGPVASENAWLLHDNPYHSADNCRVDDAAGVLDELKTFADNGGTTIVDLTPPGIGRRPQILADYSRRSGVRVVMGSGWYLESTHPPEVAALGIDALAASLISEFTAETDAPKPGVIGEIGISPSFSENEAKALRAACVAQREVNVPCSFIFRVGSATDRRCSISFWTRWVSIRARWCCATWTRRATIPITSVRSPIAGSFSNST